MAVSSIVAEPNSMLEHALAIARRGWPVFPCHPMTKQPLTENGFRDAVTDVGAITAWWQKYPNAMIGFPTGRRSGVFVLDLDAGVDDKTGEIFEVADLRKKLITAMGEDIPHTLTVNTPGGGCHIYLRMPEGQLGNRNPLMKRIDVRGEGGYVIAPPSRRADGKAYEVTVKAPVAGAPEKIVSFVKTHKEEKAPKPAKGHKISPAQSGDDRVDEARRKYALTALDNQVRDVARAPKGQRNITLNNAALALGHLVGAGILSERMVRAGLEDAAAESGLAADDGRASVQKTIDSGLAAGIAQPADLSKIGMRARAGPRQAPAASSPAPPSEVKASPSSQMGAAPGVGSSKGRGGEDEADPAEMHRACAFLPRTDLGNAERFVRRYQRDFLWCAVLGWLAWDGRRWSRENADGLLAKAVHATIRAIGKEAKAIEGTSDDFVVEQKRDRDVMFSEKIRGWGLTSQGAAHVACVARLAAPYLEIDTAQLDADPWKFNVLNGTLHVARRDEGDYVQYRPHDRADHITKLAPVDFRPDAKCPLYDQVLADVQPDDKSRRSLHQYGGYSLTGDISEQLLAFWWGKGKNGKSTIIDIWCHVAGEYADTIPIESFLDQGRSRRGGEATPDLATLPGVRMLRTSEPERGAKLAESLVKLMTGGEPMMVRHLNRDPFKFVPGFKAVIGGNYKPEIHGTDEGIWRRVKLVPWTVIIPEEKRDRALGQKLKAEASGILNRLLDGLRDYLDAGFVWGDQIDKATEAYRTDSDPVGRFLQACTMPAPGHSVQSSVMHKVFVAWARAVGEREWSAKGFGTAMRDRVRFKRSSVVWFMDIRLIRSESDFLDEHGKPIEREEIVRADDGENGEDTS